MNAIENLRKVLVDIANDNSIRAGEKSIEQKQRNTMKKRMVEALHDVLAEVCADEPSLKLFRAEKGSMMGLDNETVGIIPVEFTVAIKNLDIDPSEEEDAYNDKLAEQAAKAAKAAKVKAEKIAKSEQERALKRQLKELRNFPVSDETDELE